MSFLSKHNRQKILSIMVIDIIIGAVLLVSALIAFVRGFIREVLTILGVLGGFAAAYFFGPKAVPVFEGWLGVDEGQSVEKLFGILPYDMVAKILAYGLIFIIVVIILSFISHMLAEAARNLGLGAVDRTLGVVFGLARGLVLLALIYLPIYYVIDKETRAEFLDGSRGIVYVESLALYFAGFLPEGEPINSDDTSDTNEESQKSSARGRLTDMKILKDGFDGLSSQNSNKDEVRDAGRDAEGYNQEFRDNMNSLIQDALPDNSGGAERETNTPNDKRPQSGQPGYNQ